jgi:hypothetical protein
MRHLTTSIALLCLFAITVEAGPEYVKSKYAKMRESVRKKKSIKKIPRGDKVEKISTRRKWSKISHKGTIGWVYKRKLTSKPPKTDPSLAKKGTNAWAGEEVAAGSALRGLSPTTQKFAKAGSITKQHRAFAEYHQSYVTITNEQVRFQPKMSEKGINPVRIGTDEIENFLSEGKLGEYADVPEE